MQSTRRFSRSVYWLGSSLVIVLLLAGCMGHNSLMPWSQPEDSLEHVTGATFEERVLKCDKPVLVDFYGERCGPCKQLAPLLAEFADEHPEIRVVKVNVDDSPDLAGRFNVRYMPTLLVFRDGKVAAPPSVGLVTKAKLGQLVGSVAAKSETATAM